MLAKRGKGSVGEGEPGMTDGDRKNFKTGFQDWDIIGPGTSSLTTIRYTFFIRMYKSINLVL